MSTLIETGYHTWELEMEKSLWAEPSGKVQFEITGSRELVNSAWKLIPYCFNSKDVKEGEMSNKLRCC